MADLDEFKLSITRFDGTPSRLQPFLDDIEVFFRLKGWSYTSTGTNPDTQHGPKMSASIYMACSESVRIQLRTLSRENSINPTANCDYLKRLYGTRDQDRLTSCLDQLTSLAQRNDENLRDYVNRAINLIAKLATEEASLDFRTIGDGKLAVYYIRKGIRNKHHRDLLIINTSLKWTEFEVSLTRLYQSDTSSTENSANLSQLPYENRRKHENTSYKTDKKPATFYCKLHKENSSHNTANCKKLQAQAFANNQKSISRNGFSLEL
jgi:hypothetical protein